VLGVVADPDAPISLESANRQSRLPWVDIIIGQRGAAF
jgi:hypothetical protein